MFFDQRGEHMVINDLLLRPIVNGIHEKQAIVFHISHWESLRRADRCLCLRTGQQLKRLAMQYQRHLC